MEPPNKSQHIVVSIYFLLKLSYRHLMLRDGGVRDRRERQRVVGGGGWGRPHDLLLHRKLCRGEQKHRKWVAKIVLSGKTKKSVCLHIDSNCALKPFARGQIAWLESICTSADEGDAIQTD